MSRDTVFEPDRHDLLPLPPGESCPPLRSIGAWLASAEQLTDGPQADDPADDAPAQAWVAALAGLAADLALSLDEAERRTLAQAVATVARAQLTGHAGWPLQLWPPTQRAKVEALLSHADAARWLRAEFGLVALARSAELEARLAQALVQRLQPWSADDRDAPDAGQIEREAEAEGLSPLQARAVARAATRPLSVITGGPGTGKTSCIAVLLTLLARHRPHWRIALAAPTGKAAARMRESLAARGLAGVASGVQAEAVTELAEQQGPWIGTVHRLLNEVEVDVGMRMIGRDGLLPYDLLLIDESSMLDLELAGRLARALRPDTRWVWVGDSEQLAAVQYGVAFHALAARRADAEHDPLGDALVRLTHSHRFDAQSRLGRVAAAVADGDTARLRVELDGAVAQLADVVEPAQTDGAAAVRADASLLLVTLPSASDVGWGDDRLLDSLEQRLRPVTQAFAQGQLTPEQALRGLRDFQLLAAVRAGPGGIEHLNAALSARMRLWSASVSGPWFVGRRIVVRQNQPAIGLANGDMGMAAVGTPGRWIVWFDDGAGAARPVAVAQLPRIDDAWALTVHMAQGSEYDQVVVVLPQADSPLATREWLYTAITRARRQVALIGDVQAVLSAAARNTERHNRLIERVMAGLSPAA